MGKLGKRLGHRDTFMVIFSIYPPINQFGVTLDNGNLGGLIIWNVEWHDWVPLTPHMRTYTHTTTPPIDNG